MVNPALAVEAVGFRPWGEHWLGILITPWFMNLVLMPRVGAQVAADRRARDAALRLPGRCVRVHRRPRPDARRLPGLFAVLADVRVRRPARRARHGRWPRSTRCSTRRSASRARRRHRRRTPRPALSSRRRRSGCSASATSCSGRRREPIVGLEGELRIGLRVRDARVERSRASPRRGPTRHAPLLQGRTRADGRRRGAAPVLDLRPFPGGGQRTGLRRRRRRDHRRRRCWRATAPRCRPRSCAKAPGACCSSGRSGSASCPAPRRPPPRAASLGIQPGQAVGPGSGAIALAAFGASADEWLAQPSLTELDRWIDGGQTAAARFMRQVRDDDAATPRMADRTAVDTAAARRPVPRRMDGRAGCRQRQPTPSSRATRPGVARPPRPARWRACSADPLIAALMQRSATRVPARFVARLRELALLLAGRDRGGGRRAGPARRRLASPGSRTRAGCSSHQVALRRGPRGRLPHRRARPSGTSTPTARWHAALLGAPADDLDHRQAPRMRDWSNRWTPVSPAMSSSTMHEMSLAESVREIVDETARANGARRVAAVRLEIGKLAQVEIDAMRFAFEVVKRGSLAEAARLEIVETDGSAWCMRCSDAGGHRAARRRLPAVRQLPAAGHRRRPHAGAWTSRSSERTNNRRPDHVRDLRLRPAAKPMSRACGHPRDTCTRTPTARRTRHAHDHARTRTSTHA